MTAENNAHRYTKADLQLLLTLWGSNTVEQVAEKMGRTPIAVMTLANKFRAKGWPLEKKRRKGNTVDDLIDEVIAELKADEEV